MLRNTWHGFQQRPCKKPASTSFQTSLIIPTKTIKGNKIIHSNTSHKHKKCTNSADFVTEQPKKKVKQVSLLILFILMFHYIFIKLT